MAIGCGSRFEEKIERKIVVNCVLIFSNIFAGRFGGLIVTVSYIISPRQYEHSNQPLVAIDYEVPAHFLGGETDRKRLQYGVVDRGTGSR